MKKSAIINKLREDEHYYGKFGQQYLSNSDIKTLLKNPLDLHKPTKSNPNFLVGGYFHTAILEPNKIKKFKIIESSSRNTKVYKEMSGGELCLLQHEVDMIEALVDKIMNNNVCRDLISPSIAHVDYEEPAIAEINGQMWKGKADILNHEEQLIIDLKTTSDLDKFRIDALKETGVSFCTRNHFGTPSIGENNKYIRLAYSGINQEEIKSGLSKFKEWVE